MKRAEFQALLTLAEMMRRPGWTFEIAAQKARETMSRALIEFPDAFDGEGKEGRYEEKSKEKNKKGKVLNA